MKREKAWLVWMGGADSAVTLFEAKSPEFKLQGLLGLSIAGLTVSTAMLRAQAESLEISFTPLAPEVSDNTTESWRIDNEEELKALFKQKKTEALIFTFHKESPLVKAAMNCASRLGLHARFPLWNWPSEEIVRVFFNLRFDAAVVSVDERKMPATFLGQSFSAKLKERLPKGCDVAGLLGEFGLFVYNGPFFQTSLPSKFETSSKMGNYLSFDFNSP